MCSVCSLRHKHFYLPKKALRHKSFLHYSVLECENIMNNNKNVNFPNITVFTPNVFASCKVGFLYMIH